MQLHRDHRPQPSADLPPARGTSMADAHEHISCQQVVELVTDYLEGSLATDESALFEQHLNFCDGCEWYLDQMRSTVAAVGRIKATDVPPAMRERLLVAFRDRTRS
jgi:anti-sigma factor RsiW